MLKQSIDKIKKRSNNLILITGPSGSGKTKFLQDISTKEKYPYINLNFELSKRLHDLPEEKRKLDNSVSDLINEQHSEIIIFDNSEIFFAKELCINPLQLLKSQNRKKIIVMAWNGFYDGENLTYAKPGDEEFQKFSKDDLDGIEIIKMSDLR